VWCEISPTDRGGSPAHALGARAGRPRRTRRFRRTARIVWRTTARAHRNRGRWLDWAARRRLEWAAHLCQVAGPALSAIAHVGVARRVGSHPALSPTVEAQPRGWRAGGLPACDRSLTRHVPTAPPGRAQPPLRRVELVCQLDTLLDKHSLPALELAQVINGHLSECSRRGAGASSRTSQASGGSRSRA
jgi:hypothetical protein